MTDEDFLRDPERVALRRARAREYLAQLDDRDPGTGAMVDREEFLHEYATGTATLDEVYRVCRAKKNQREALLRKKLRYGGEQ